MYTSIDKALVGVVMGILFIATTLFHINLPGFLTEANVTQVLAVLTPILVYLIPNKSPA